jgi:hypothetical protein
MRMLWFKSRKYPIQRDEYGQSLRRRCFDYFDQGKRPADVAGILNMKERTSFRYFSDWQKTEPYIYARYKAIRELKKKQPELFQGVIDEVADYLGITRNEAILKLEKPHGLKQLLTGKWPNLRHAKFNEVKEARLAAALHLVRFLENLGMPIEFIRYELPKFIQKAAAYGVQNKEQQ